MCRRSASRASASETNSTKASPVPFMRLFVPSVDTTAAAVFAAEEAAAAAAAAVKAALSATARGGRGDSSEGAVTASTAGTRPTAAEREVAGPILTSRIRGSRSATARFPPPPSPRFGSQTVTARKFVLVAALMSAPAAAPASASSPSPKCLPTSRLAPPAIPDGQTARFRPSHAHVRPSTQSRTKLASNSALRDADDSPSACADE